MGFVAEESPSSLRHSVLHLWASIMDRSVTQACRAALSGDEEALKCRSSVPCRTLGRRKCTKVLPKRAALHPRATKSVGFVAEEPHSSLRHSVLHLWASVMDRSVTQACRAALLGDENVRKCCLSVPRYTLGRRKVWVSLPKSPIHPYVILPCTFRQRKWAEVSPESVVLHSRATKMLGSVTQACRVALSGDDIGLKCCLRWGVGSHRSTSLLGRAVELHRWDTPWNCTVGTRRGTAPGLLPYVAILAIPC